MSLGKRLFRKMVMGYRISLARSYREQAAQISLGQQLQSAQQPIQAQQISQQQSQVQQPQMMQPAVSQIQQLPQGGQIYVTQKPQQILQTQPIQIQTVQTTPIVVPYPTRISGVPPQLTRAQQEAIQKEEAERAEASSLATSQASELHVRVGPLISEESTEEGLEIPKFLPKKVKAVKHELEEVAKREIVYPLIPREPAKGEGVLAAARIYWERKTNRYVYQIIEPELTEEIKEMSVRVKDILEEKLDVDFSKLKLAEAADYLNKEIDEVISYYGFRFSPEQRRVLRYYIERDFLGLGKIEPIMRDPNIEDISCDGIGIPIFIFHRNQDLGSVVTNVVYKDGDELDSFITKLAQLTGKTISVAQPLVDGSLPDGSRLQATLATDIARKGSNFTIRKFTEEPLTPIHLLNYGTVDIRSLAYLWLAVDYGRSVLVSGGTASGKTSFLNVLSLFIRPDKKIISIEDTAELRLPHPHWVPTIARTAISLEGKAGEVDMFQLLKESMRQRPDYIIVGEVRGQEAYILFQQMATGHPSLATIHAENAEKLLDRLTTPPISLPKSLVGSLDVVVFMSRMRYRDKFVRRVNEILEMVKFDPVSDRPVVNRVFKWNPFNDKIESVGNSFLLKKISDSTGVPQQEILEELERRMLVLNWMQERDISEYQDIYKIINMYYYYPNRVIGAIMGEE